jgi:alcohol dehydrogenase class IV
MTDGLAREGMLRAAKSLYRTFTHGDEVAARTDMAIVSLFGAYPVDIMSCCIIVNLGIGRQINSSSH